MHVLADSIPLERPLIGVSTAAAFFGNHLLKVANGNRVLSSRIVHSWRRPSEGCDFGGADLIPASTCHIRRLPYNEAMICAAHRLPGDTFSHTEGEQA